MKENDGRRVERRKWYEWRERRGEKSIAISRLCRVINQIYFIASAAKQFIHFTFLDLVFL